MSSRILLRSFLEPRLDEAARTWLDAATDEVAAGVADTRFGALVSLAARKLGFGARERWQLDPAELDAATTLMEGWTPARWTALEAARVVLVLARPDLLEATGPTAIEAAFRFADAGELCALYRSLGHLPQPEAYLWRAAEGCRTNMLDVFEADVCDTPYPTLHFDDVAYNQAVIKALFIGAPLWRLWGLDRRLSPDLARMALDLVEERRSAHREVQPDLWMCLGTFGGERGLAAIELELAPFLTGAAETADPGTIDPLSFPRSANGARAAILALGRAGASARLGQLKTTAPDFLAKEASQALVGGANQLAWARFDPREAQNTTPART